MLAMRAYMRAKTVDGVIDEAVAAKVGLSSAQIEEMYQIMAIANYEDRFVIPTTHREVTEDAYELRGQCGFSFGDGCLPSDRFRQPVWRREGQERQAQSGSVLR
jgi:nitrate reductase beta subunit